MASLNETAYALSTNLDQVYYIKNVGGELSITYENCQADVRIQSGSFLGVTPYSSDNGVPFGASVHTGMMLTTLGVSMILLTQI